MNLVAVPLMRRKIILRNLSFYEYGEETVLEMFAKVSFVDIGVESEVVRIPQQASNLADRESQREQFLDTWKVGVKLAFLNGSFWLS